MAAHRTTLVDPVTGRSWPVPTNRLDGWHLIQIKDAGWALTHPITCDLDDCDFNRIAETWHQPPAAVGTYRWLEPDDSWVPNG